MGSRDEIFYYGMISLWEYWALLTWEVEKGILDDLRHLFCCFQAMKGPLGSRMVLKGQTSVPWEVGMKYSTMGWFHYGNTDHYWLERWTKGYLMIWGVLFVVLRQWRAPWGSPMVLNGQSSVSWEVEIKYSTVGWFHYGNSEHYSHERWTKKYLKIWSISFAVFRQWRAP